MRLGNSGKYPGLFLLSLAAAELAGKEHGTGAFLGYQFAGCLKRK